MQRGSRTGGEISKKIRAGEAARRNENGYEKAVREEKRKKEKRSKSIAAKIG